MKESRCVNNIWGYTEYYTEIFDFYTKYEPPWGPQGGGALRAPLWAPGGTPPLGPGRDFPTSSRAQSAPVLRAGFLASLACCGQHAWQSCRAGCVSSFRKILGSSQLTWYTRKVEAGEAGWIKELQNPTFCNKYGKSRLYSFAVKDRVSQQVHCSNMVTRMYIFLFF